MNPAFIQSGVLTPKEFARYKLCWWERYRQYNWIIAGTLLGLGYQVSRQDVEQAPGGDRLCSQETVCRSCGKKYYTVCINCEYRNGSEFYETEDYISPPEPRYRFKEAALMMGYNHP